MGWDQVLIIIAANLGLFLWNRTESRADIRQTDAKIEIIRTETNALINSIREETNSIREESKAFQKAILDEMRDFHGRLCSIEERYRQKNN